MRGSIRKHHWTEEFIRKTVNATLIVNEDDVYRAVMSFAPDVQEKPLVWVLVTFAASF